MEAPMTMRLLLRVFLLLAIGAGVPSLAATPALAGVRSGGAEGRRPGRHRRHRERQRERRRDRQEHHEAERPHEL
jgi:hypothetical protein